jgi:gamma-glutamyltranspeptidase
MWFGLVQLVFKKLFKSNQKNVVWIGSIGTVYTIIFQCQTILNIQKENLKFQNIITVPIKLVYPK